MLFLFSFQPRWLLLGVGVHVGVRMSRVCVHVRMVSVHRICRVTHCLVRFVGELVGLGLDVVRHCVHLVGDGVHRVSSVLVDVGGRIRLVAASGHAERTEC